MADNEDGFGLFGSDSESDNDDAPILSTAGIDLMKAKAQSSSSAPLPPSSITNPSIHTLSLSPPPPPPVPLPPLWPTPPIHVGNIVLNQESASYGGSRSFTAQCDLHPGALLIRELPLITWPSTQIGKPLGIEAVAHIITSNKVSAFDSLHPVNLQTDVPQDEVSKIQAKYSSAISSLSSTSSLPPPTILRLLMTLICNGFESGVYGYLSIFNHSESPNCIKLQPNNNDSQPYSEVRALRPIKEGEHLTISYVNPREQTFTTRQAYFKAQHFFDISVEIESSNLTTVKKYDSLSPSGLPELEEEAISSIENTLNSFDPLLSEIVEAQKQIKQLSTSHNTLEAKTTYAEKASDLYSASIELSKTYHERLPNLTHHIIRIRLLKFLRDVSSSVLDFSEDFDSEVLKTFTKSSYDLFHLQIEYLGEYHPDLGTTCLDLAEGISLLLARDPQGLFDLKFDNLQSVVSCAKFEGKMRKMFREIKEMHETT
ncbi:hypothetical protein TL16_g07222 [Triparma laevis f. inornata]|uniref:SET domain-containing protein n=2 Tax=Triparma laevis TaxID=1534972 RepID=A0A9W7AB16_9STRA|nr:hypothetical protein TrLO_g8424 [Triparma laevis f. longispina]GMH76869.1 hypothetical protein TL16_g07222 [Triparma laevis f. inornata]